MRRGGSETSPQAGCCRSPSFHLRSGTGSGRGPPSCPPANLRRDFLPNTVGAAETRRGAEPRTAPLRDRNYTAVCSLTKRDPAPAGQFVQEHPPTCDVLVWPFWPCPRSRSAWASDQPRHSLPLTARPIPKPVSIRSPTATAGVVMAMVIAASVGIARTGMVVGTTMAGGVVASVSMLAPAMGTSRTASGCGAAPSRQAARTGGGATGRALTRVLCGARRVTQRRAEAVAAALPHATERPTLSAPADLPATTLARNLRGSPQSPGLGSLF